MSGDPITHKSTFCTGLHVWHAALAVHILGSTVEEPNQMDTEEKTRVELEAAVYRRLVEHLSKRTDVQNIDLMILAGFCRNCLSDWMREAADAKGISMSKDKSR